jgi:hypothetical protein
MPYGSSDKFATQDLANQFLTLYKRRAVFVAKCARESVAINASARLKRRVELQWRQLCYAVGVEPTLPSAWNLAVANAIALKGSTEALRLAEFYDVSEAVLIQAIGGGSDYFNMKLFGPTQTQTYAESLNYYPITP